jgi:hypothetical protein
MKQMYLLSVIVNLWIGFWFILPWLSQKYPIFLDLKTFTDRIPLQSKLGFAIFLLALGLVKMLFFSYGLIIVGDFFPSLMLIIASLVLLSEVLQEKPDTLPLEAKWTHAMEAVQEKKTLIGFLCIAAGLGHFLLADIVFF